MARLDLRVPIYIDDAGVEYQGKDWVDAARFHLGDPGLFFTERGVKPEIIKARGYDEWFPQHPEPLQKAWFPHIPQSKRGWVTRVARQSAGYLIPRYPPPDMGLEPIPDEIRPLKAIDTQPGNSAKYVFPPGDGNAKRLDMHPHAVPLFRDATRVFFGIEGCIKADAMLSQGEAVFSVPSVWMFDCPEMGAFVERYLRDKTVFIVPDGDWIKKWQVRSAAIRCSSYLRGFGLKKVFVAAPPPELLAEGIKGVDDFLGAGHPLDDMQVIGREMPDAFEQWMAHIGGRIDGASRDAEVLQALSLSAGLIEKEDGEEVEREGEIYRSIKPTMRLINAANPNRRMCPKDVREAIDSLTKRPGLTSHRAITISGSLETQEPEFKEGKLLGRPLHSVSEDDAPGRAWGNGDYWTEYNWKDRPRITIAPELRAQDRDPIRVGDLMDDLTIESIQQFSWRDVSRERLRELRGESA